MTSSPEKVRGSLEERSGGLVRWVYADFGCHVAIVQPFCQVILVFSKPCLLETPRFQQACASTFSLFKIAHGFMTWSFSASPNTHKVTENGFEKREGKKKLTVSVNTEDYKDPYRRLFFSLSLCGWFYLNRWVDL